MNNKSELTQSELKKFLYYDEKTGIFTWINSHWKSKVGNVAGSLDSRGYIVIGLHGFLYTAHRLAWLYVTGRFPSEFIDHIDGCRNKNSFSNLREATNKQNLQNNRVPRKNNKTGFLGVSKYGKGFRAQIRIDGTTKQLGVFKTPEQAHAAYVEAKRKHHEFCTI